MTSINQRAELQAKIWKIANDVRGSVDGWDFKQFVLGTLFYRFISENFTNYIEGGDESVKYPSLSDDVITPEIKDDAVKTKGYFIYPSQLFVNVAKTANTNSNLNTDLKAIFDSIESSANGYPSEQDIKGLFADFDTTSSRLGNTVENKNSRLASVIKGVEELNFGKFEESEIELFGDAYEFLIGNYAANAGKSGGEFFTPVHVSKLIAQLAMHGQTTVNKIYDPAAGSGSLLLQAKKHFDDHIIEEGFFGQEVNHTTYNLARMNMFLHNINYDKFHIVLGDTLRNPQLADEKPFDAIVSNPPYSVKWIGDADPTMINDDRFAPAGVLAPKSKADFAFVLHCLSYLSSKGRAALVCFPGIFYRGGAEQKIRKYLVDNNYVETVISLAPNLFYGTTIAVNLLVLSKHKAENKTQFIDASGEDFFKKVTNNNVMTDKHIAKVVEIFASKEDIAHVAISIDNSAIAENDYNLTVSKYVEQISIQQEINIDDLNEDLYQTVNKINSLRNDLNDLIENFTEDNNIDFISKLLDGSSVEWVTLSDIATITIGEFVHKSKQDDSAEYPVYNGGITPTGYYSKYNNTGNKIIVSARGANAGFVNRISTPYWAGNSCYSVGLINPEKINWIYIYYYLKGNENQLIGGQQKGGGVPAVSKKQMESFMIPIPPIDAQNRIVDLMDGLTRTTADLEVKLQSELEARKRQYEFYRDILLTFPKDNLEE
ncbi:type I restriction-modification system subunit M [bacterium]|nr:type I restriction-modification system subunit M [bacterium]